MCGAVGFINSGVAAGHQDGCPAIAPEVRSVTLTHIGNDVYRIDGKGSSGTMAFCLATCAIRGWSIAAVFS